MSMASLRFHLSPTLLGEAGVWLQFQDVSLAEKSDIKVFQKAGLAEHHGFFAREIGIGNRGYWKLPTERLRAADHFDFKMSPN